MELTKEYLCVPFKKMHHTILRYLMLIRIGWAGLYLEQYLEKKVYEIRKMWLWGIKNKSVKFGPFALLPFFCGTFLDRIMPFQPFGMMLSVLPRNMKISL